MQWLELHNVTDSAIDLTLWEVSSSAQSFSNRMPAGTSIPARGYLVFFEKDVGFTMGNVTLSLLDTNNNMVDSVGVPNLPADQSYARIPDGMGGWQVDPSPTLGGANIFLAPTATPDLQATASAIQTVLAQPLPSPPAFDDDLPDATDVETARRTPHSRKGQPYKQLAISDIRGLPDDTPVVTNGVVTLPTGLWETSRAYIQDQAGILVHAFADQQLQLGENVSIRGRVHHFHGEVEIAAVKGGLQDSSGGTVPDPRIAAPHDVGPALEALLVRVAGRVGALQPDYVSVVDDSASSRVLLYSNLAVHRTALTPGQPLTVTGVVNAADPAAQGAAINQPGSTHRLLPRTPEDLVIGGDPGAQSSSSRRSERGGPSSSQRDGPGRTIGVGVAFAGATPTQFATPVLSRRQTNTVLDLPAGVTALRLLGSGLATAPVWLWPVLAVAAGVLAGSGISAALWWRRVRPANGAAAPPMAAESEAGSLEDQPPEE